MDWDIAAILVQDGIVNGAVYALLALSLVLVFAVTRVVLIPQGEFVAYGALTYAALDEGKLPGSLWLLAALGLGAFLVGLWQDRGQRLARLAVTCLVVPGLAILATWQLAGFRLGPWMDAALTLAIVTPMAPCLYRLAFHRLAHASVLVLLMAAVGVHLVMVGLGLVFFGPEGFRGPPLTEGRLVFGPIMLTAQAGWVLAVTLALMAALAVFFARSLTGKALRATAVNRLGARLVGIGTASAGRLAFTMAGFIGALSGVLVAPLATIYYDSGFIIGLKGFVAAIIGGMASYPLAALAAILVGIVEAFAAFWASPFKEAIVFTIIIPVLLWRSLARVPGEEAE
jgi:branched-chain amino acid transport system permease protein